MSGRPGGAATADHDAGTWSHLQNSDIRAYRAQLEAEGFPPRLARVLATEEIRRQFAPRRAALNLKGNERPFWEQTIRDPQTAAALRQINREQAQAIRDLLGPDPSDLATEVLRNQLPSLSEDKIMQIMRVQQAFDDRRAEINTNALGPVMNSDRLETLAREQRAEIAKFLTPEEIEAYDLRTSNLANQLRNQFAAFDATENEFLAVYRLRNSFADRLPQLYGTQSPEAAQARAVIQQELDDQIHAALGDERFAQYLKSKDSNYQVTNRLVGRLDLPRSATDEVWAVQEDIKQRLTAVRADPSLTPAARTAQIAALTDETRSRITATLGERGFEAYKQYGGNWMQMLQWAPSAPPPRPAR